MKLCPRVFASIFLPRLHLARSTHCELLDIYIYPMVIAFSRIARVAARVFVGGRVEQNVFMTRELIRSVVEMAERTSSVDAFDQGAYPPGDQVR